MDKRHDTVLETLMEQLIEGGAENMGLVFARVFDLAMQIERERFLGAQHYERSPFRQGYANGYKAKRIDTPAGTVTINVPKTAGHDEEPFYPQSLERGRRSTRAVMLAVAEMYVKGVSTREVEAFRYASLRATRGVHSRNRMRKVQGDSYSCFQPGERHKGGLAVKMRWS